LRQRALSFGLCIASAAVVAIVAACGDGPEPTLDAYIPDVFITLIDTDERGDELTAAFPSVFDTTLPVGQRVNNAEQWSRDFAANYEQALEELERLEPPADVLAEHTELVESMRELAIRASGVPGAVRARNVNTLIQFREVLDEEGTLEAGERFVTACLEMERIAALNNIVTDLQCGEDEPEPDGEATPTPAADQPSPAP